MKNYLAIIRKSDFNDLYRYGYIRIDPKSSVEFLCSPEELSSHREVFDELANNANAFDNAFVYTLIHFSLADEVPYNRISIEDVQHIYPLDIESYKEFSTSFDPKIQISKPLWNDAVFELQKKWAVDSAIKGANNIWKIFGITYPISKVQALIPNSIVEQTIDNLYSDMPIRGDYPLLVYLLRYERHSFYPKDQKGFFMDIIHTYCNYAMQQEADSEQVEKTKAYNVISKIKDGDNYNSIVKKCLIDKHLKNFIDKLKVLCPDFSFFEVSPIFLHLREKYSEGIKGNNFNEIYKSYNKIVNSEEILAIAMYLLGIVLGHEKTYDALYETLPLPIFVKETNVQKKDILVREQKTKETPNANDERGEVPLIINPVHEEEMASDSPSSITIPSKIDGRQDVEDIQSVNTDNSENDLDYIEIYEGMFPRKIQIPFYMGQLYTRGKNKGKIKSSTIVKITGKEEYAEYVSKGFVIDEQK